MNLLQTKDIKSKNKYKNNLLVKNNQFNKSN